MKIASCKHNLIFLDLIVLLARFFLNLSITQIDMGFYLSSL
jgi:hypothetical protein